MAFLPNDNGGNDSNQHQGYNGGKAEVEVLFLEIQLQVLRPFCLIIIALRNGIRLCADLLLGSGCGTIV